MLERLLSYVRLALGALALAAFPFLPSLRALLAWSSLRTVAGAPLRAFP